MPAWTIPWPTVTYAAAPPNGPSAHYNGQYILANSAYLTGCCWYSGELHINFFPSASGTMDFGTDILRIDFDDFSLNDTYTHGGSYANACGVSGVPGGGSMYGAYSNDKLGSQQYIDLIEWNIGSTVGAKLVTVNFGSPAYCGWLDVLFDSSLSATHIHFGSTAGSNSGSRFNVWDIAGGTMTNLTLNSAGGMSIHSGFGASVCYFDGKWFFGGAGSNVTAVPIWRYNAALSLLDAWEGGDSAVTGAVSGNINASGYANEVFLRRTSDTSGAKRLYAICCGAPKIAYKTSATGAWSNISLPTGEYCQQGSNKIGMADNGKVYFVTQTAANSSGGGTIRLRSVDEAGTIALIATLPSAATMFPSTSGAEIACAAVTPNVGTDGLVSCVTVIMRRQDSGGHDFYVAEFNV